MRPVGELRYKILAFALATALVIVLIGSLVAFRDRRHLSQSEQKRVEAYYLNGLDAVRRGQFITP
ncbi:MAG TPA: hypothetical protein PLU88_12170 [Armatimonadota bacterium]|jgi:hypothetical protein|nr:hypothetical protein [Armatimonadota bacterium]